MFDHVGKKIMNFVETVYVIIVALFFIMGVILIIASIGSNQIALMWIGIVLCIAALLIKYLLFLPMYAFGQIAANMEEMSEIIQAQSETINQTSKCINEIYLKLSSISPDNSYSTLSESEKDEIIKKYNHLKEEADKEVTVQ